MKQLRIALVGATGMVGRTFIEILEEYGMTGHDYTLFASARSAGKTLTMMNRDYIVQELTDSSFDTGFDIALFSAGGSASGHFAPIAASKGCIVIDNSSRWRMDPSVPLVVPEVNAEDIFKNNGIIANPNCSTIQAVVALKPLHDKYGIKRVVYSTYQSVSGSGQKGFDDLEAGVRSYCSDTPYEPRQYPYPIFGNCIPHIDSFMDTGYTKEEQKMIDETRKILHDDDIAITATTVRVPVYYGHSEAVNVELKQPYDLDELKETLRNGAGIVVIDDPQKNMYPMPIQAAGSDNVFVGRIRRDFSIENGVNLWVVADNIRKGAASNAVQIAQELIKGL